jgi:prepilin-type N-terminal cleavage/methylation domain-containing protein
VRRAAFTLIELLVTIVLFTLLLATALYSFRFASLDIRNINNTNPQKAMHYNKLRDAISSIYPYVHYNKKEQNIYLAYYYFFEGKEKECYFITKSGFFYQGLVLSHLYYKDGSLWYEEGEIFKDGVDYSNLKEIPLKKKILLEHDLSNLFFVYVGIESSSKELLKEIPTLVQIVFEKNKKNRVYSFDIHTNNNSILKRTLRQREL